MTHLTKFWQNSALMTRASIIIIIIIATVILIIIIKRYFLPLNLAQLKQDINSFKANIFRFKSLIENNKSIAEFKHGYTSDGAKSSPALKFFTDFEKTLIGKLLKMLGSISIFLSILFRSKIDISETFLASIYDIEPVVTMIAIFGSVYSSYLLIYLLCKLKTSALYLIKGKWIKRREKKNKNIHIEYYYIFFFFSIRY